MLMKCQYRSTFYINFKLKILILQMTGTDEKLQTH